MRRAIGRLLGRGEREPAPAPLIVGVGHSGTTLLRLTLDAHRELTLPLAAWKRKMTPERLAAFEAEAGGLLSELGHEPGAGEPARA